ncbi:Protein CBG28062 [Caenorhabditis briggsae]|uniref:Protein CBG28062 n=1 Tax=Caenorhabditis briggsae TaxID=6238 RepID=B6IGQ2_CAEBR|nr:Protein CBG28062 [Caenorhabditis briggsae]CAR99082.1 Protein CBG28062 [Caenorhabditis briggsae]
MRDYVIICLFRSPLFLYSRIQFLFLCQLILYYSTRTLVAQNMHDEALEKKGTPTRRKSIDCSYVISAEFHFEISSTFCFRMTPGFFIKNCFFRNLLNT